jgi:uncharacterized membrane protein
MRQSPAMEFVPNCSLTPRQACDFFAPLRVLSFTIAGGCAAQVLWPALLLTGLETAALGWMLGASPERLVGTVEESPLLVATTGG